MHNGFVRIDEEKMSKSLDNFFTVREVLKTFRPEIIRFFILSSHYRSPLNYSNEQLEDAKAALTRLYTALRDVDIESATCDAHYQKRFTDAMDDDFNTPVAIAVLFDLARELNSHKADKSRARILAYTLKNLAGVLGLLQDNAETFLKGTEKQESLSEDEIDLQIQARTEAKNNKNWAQADQIRDELKEQGIILEDAPGGKTTWRREL
jgi:cysteinyl-tRNA synthetase